VEHPFRIIKRQFGFVKARYKGLLRNDNQLGCYSPWPTCFGWTK
jgi:IS5 family transposase